MSYVYVQPTLPSSNRIYTGSCYAFGASGGFKLLQGFNQINERKPDIMTKYDVTNAIQVHFSARTLNKKITIIKDNSNTHTVQASYDPETDRLLYDSIKLCSCEFIDGITTDSIVSVGSLQSLYSDFKSCVSSYFGDPGGFASLFSMDQDFDVNNGIFDASAFIQVVNTSKFSMTGSFVSDLSGYVTISDINNLLQYVVDGNIFNNRDPRILNWGVVQGFVAGDLIFIPTGFTITLSLDIQPETYLPVNNIGPANLNAISSQLNWTQGYVTRSTTSTTTNISQTTTVPMLLILTDDEVQNNLNFGISWTTTSPLNSIGPNNWTSISISTTGQYQSLISETGLVYTTSDFGQSWTNTKNISPSPSNYIAISFTGMHQTISNGTKIWVSSDYGKTWQQTYNSGTSNIFVSISLNGKYQTLVSSGDNVYTSSNYGLTWTPLDQGTDLYQSIETFPTGGIAISYNGQFQTIVVENIYVSSDFGRTWVNVSDPNGFDDRNWEGVAMSSDGKYQTAIENGGEVHISNDYGNTWNYVPDPSMIDINWAAVAVSATGQYQSVLEQYGKIFVSSDYGNTWKPSPDPLVTNKNWQTVALSSDSNVHVAVDTSGVVYTSSLLTIKSGTTMDASGNLILDSSGGGPCICPYDPSQNLITTPGSNGVLPVSNLYVSSTSAAATVSWNMDVSGNSLFYAKLVPSNLDNMSDFNIVNASSFTINRLTSATTYNIYVSRKVYDASRNLQISDPVHYTFHTTF